MQDSQGQFWRKRLASSASTVVFFHKSHQWLVAYRTGAEMTHHPGQLAGRIQVHAMRVPSTLDNHKLGLASSTTTGSTATSTSPSHFSGTVLFRKRRLR